MPYILCMDMNIYMIYDVLPCNAPCTQVESGSDPRQPEDVRAAAADALRASRLLCRSNIAAAGDEEGVLLLRAWLAAVRLTEDEDEEARARAAAMVQAAVVTVSQPGAPQTSSQPAQRLLQVEEVQRRAFPELLARFGAGGAAGAVSALAGALCDWVSDPREGLPELLSQLPTAGPAASTVRGRIFDREADNHHEEPLFMAQLASQQLQRLLASQPGAAPAVTALVRGKAEAALGRLEEAVGVMVGGAGDAVMSDMNGAAGTGCGPEGEEGGAGVLSAAHDPTVFPYLYRQLLLVLVALGGAAVTAVAAPGVSAGTPVTGQEFVGRVQRAVEGLIRVRGGCGPLAPVLAAVAAAAAAVQSEAAVVVSVQQAMARTPFFLTDDGSHCLEA